MNTEDRYEDWEDLGSRHLLLKTAGVLGVLMLLVGFMWVLAETPKNTKNLTYAGGRVTSIADHELMLARTGDAPHPARAVGTSGIAAAGEENVAFEATEPAVIRELETITGAVDRSELIGRQVDLRVPIQDEGNRVVFWIGAPDNRLLVLLNRDRRDSSLRQAGLLAPHEIDPIEAGRQAAISGTIQELPDAEERYSWNLTRDQLREVEARRVYLRADSVRIDGAAE